MKNVLVLGAGFVSGPVVNYLSKSNNVTLIDTNQKNLEEIRKKVQSPNILYKNRNALGDISDLITNSDVIVSLLPAEIRGEPVHHHIAQQAMKKGKPTVTASYVKPQMQALDQEAKEKGILILNEVGLDPGIDHMSAMQIFDRVKKNNGQITSFESYCGGLPSKKENNPFGYQLSWAPRGVLKAAKNDARFIKNGQLVEISPGELFQNQFGIDVPGLGNLEGYFNRDSTEYILKYGLEGIGTFIRGTLRFPGWCDALQAITNLGLLDENPIGESGLNYNNLLSRLIGIQRKVSPQDLSDYLEVMQPSEEGGPDFLRAYEPKEIVEKFQWLGLFSNKPIPENASPLDALLELVEEKMQYQPGQTDMVVLQHQIGAQYGNRNEQITSTLVYHGAPVGSNGFSAMAQTVGLPTAYAAELVLNNELAGKSGVIIPTSPEIYNPILNKLEADGISFQEKISGDDVK